MLVTRITVTRITICSTKSIIVFKRLWNTYKGKEKSCYTFEYKKIEPLLDNFNQKMHNRTKYGGEIQI